MSVATDHPFKWAAARVLVWVLLIGGQPEVAMEIVADARQNSPTSLNPYWETCAGYALLELGRFEEARSTLLAAADAAAQHENLASIYHPLSLAALARLPQTSTVARDSLLEQSRDALFHGIVHGGGDWMPWRAYALEKTVALLRSSGREDDASEYALALDALRQRMEAAWTLDFERASGIYR